MLTIAPLSVLLLGVLGLAVIVAAVARIVVLEHQVSRQILLVDPGAQERTRVAA